jgi:Na+/H+-dicarboxylate symporter
MCRTALNVTGDLAMAVVVAHRSGGEDPEAVMVEDVPGRDSAPPGMGQ